MRDRKPFSRRYVDQVNIEKNEWLFPIYSELHEVHKLEVETKIVIKKRIKNTVQQKEMGRGKRM